MGVDANALLTEVKDPLEILHHLDTCKWVKKASISPSSMENFVYINFEWSGEMRHMAVFYNGNCKNDYRLIYPFDATLCGIGKWGFSDAIVVWFAKTFGGFYRLDDCSGDWVKA